MLGSPPRQIALSLRQRGQSPRQATPRLSQWTALSPRQSAVSQAGNPQASPVDNALSQAESDVSQASNPQAAPAVRHSARLRASQASQNNNSQAGSSQAGNTPLADSVISQSDSKASQLGIPQTNASQVTSSASPWETRSSPSQ